MWSVSQATAQSGTSTSDRCAAVSPSNLEALLGEGVLLAEAAQILASPSCAGRLVLSPFQNSRSNAGGVSPIM